MMNKPLRKETFINHESKSKKCVVIQFPNKQPKTEVKIASMGCCKTDMINWDFSRGF